jgi:2-oxoisovalerate dehydrogenase E1 component
MMIIRAFENMLESVKKQGHFNNIEYNHRGPSHLSIGQEATAVGQAFLLGTDDHIYGSHRSHGEIFARDTGLNRGFGGSMHAFFPPFGVYPNNAIVGGPADISVGAALFKHINKKPGIVIANLERLLQSIAD